MDPEINSGSGMAENSGSGMAMNERTGQGTKRENPLRSLKSTPGLSFTNWFYRLTDL